METQKMCSPELVSVVMRTVGGRSKEIRRAIASVAANTWRPLEVIVVYQGTQNTEWIELQKLPGEFTDLTIRVIHNNATGDRRAENLNIGWEASRGRYLGFLDDDDTLSPNHFALLVHAMQSSSLAWAYAQVILRKEDEALNIVNESRPFRRHSFSLKALWEENFLPIHCFLLDRSELCEAMRRRPFHEELDRSEDWDFLLRLAFYHKPVVIDEFTATYHVSTGARNTNLSLMNTTNDEDKERRNRDAWARCQSIVEDRKNALIPPLWWAREYFSQERMPSSQKVSIEPVRRRSISQRIVRKLIRVLESLL